MAGPWEQPIQPPIVPPLYPPLHPAPPSGQEIARREAEYWAATGQLPPAAATPPSPQPGIDQRVEEAASALSAAGDPGLLPYGATEGWGLLKMWRNDEFFVRVLDKDGELRWCREPGWWDRAGGPPGTATGTIGERLEVLTDAATARPQELVDYARDARALIELHDEALSVDRDVRRAYRGLSSLPPRKAAKFRRKNEAAVRLLDRFSTEFGDS